MTQNAQIAENMPVNDLFDQIIPDNVASLQDLLDGAKVDLEKHGAKRHKPNKAAALRARKKLQDMKKVCQTLRVALLHGGAKGASSEDAEVAEVAETTEEAGGDEEAPAAEPEGAAPKKKRKTGKQATEQPPVVEVASDRAAPKPVAKKAKIVFSK